MPNLTPELLPRLRATRLLQLELGEGSVHPVYGGFSVANLPGSLCAWLGAPPLGMRPLDPEISRHLNPTYRRVVLILMDALSLRRLQDWIGWGWAQVWGDLSGQGLLAPLTSIIPSTTSTVLTSLWTGRPAREHGMVGYEMWLKEYGIVVNTILHAPNSYRGDAGSLRRAGFDPQSFLGLLTLGEHLKRHGVGVHAFQHQAIARSGLSQMLLKEAEVHTFSTAADLFVNLRRAVEGSLADTRSYRRDFFWVYWGEVDHFSHLYGPDDERTAEEFANSSAAFERLFLDRLSPAAREGTLLILMADHGQIATQPDPHCDLRNHPGLARRLHILPTGENRLMNLFIRPGQVEAVQEYFQRTWPDQFAFVDPAYAVETGLYGPTVAGDLDDVGPPHPRLADRLGDLLVAAQGSAYLWWGSQENHLYGRHGGLSPDEMLVPFLAASL